MTPPAAPGQDPLSSNPNDPNNPNWGQTLLAELSSGNIGSQANALFGPGAGAGGSGGQYGAGNAAPNGPTGPQNLMSLLGAMNQNMNAQPKSYAPPPDPFAPGTSLQQGLTNYIGQISGNMASEANKAGSANVSLGDNPITTSSSMASTALPDLSTLYSQAQLHPTGPTSLMPVPPPSAPGAAPAAAK